MRWASGAGLAIATLLAGCDLRGEQTDAALAERARVAGNQVMASLNNSMVDPWTVVWGAVWANGGRICGSFNPRDSAGKYVGFKRFVGQGRGNVLVDGVAPANAFTTEWRAYCEHAHMLVRDGQPGAPQLHPMTRKERAAEAAAFKATPMRLPIGKRDTA